MIFKAMGKPSIVYLTCNDQPSGVYFSQVSDVCRYYEEELGIPARLIAIVSTRGYFSSRRALKKSWKRTCVLPMAPGIQRWKWNSILLTLVALFLRKRVWIARNPHAAALAMKLKRKGLANKVCYDGRGAVYQEWTEYNIGDDSSFLNELKELEKNAVQQSDSRISVSEALKTYWQNEMELNGDYTFVIPCTLNFHSSKEPFPDPQALIMVRKLLGYSVQDLVIAYSGSSAGWQSGKLMDSFFRSLLSKNPASKILMLSPETEETQKLKTEFPNNVKQIWVQPSQVNSMLQACDYGLLVREKSITNQVASPTKFAEYLHAGLKILISPHIGDFSAFVVENDCGFIIPEAAPTLASINYLEKMRLHELAIRQFSKSNFRKNYEAIANE